MSHHRPVTTLVGIILCISAVDAKDKELKASPMPHDTIEIVGHIALSGSSITSFIDTQHYSSDYLYAEHGADGGLTLIDVTDARKPTVLANVRVSPGPRAETLLAVAGTAALVDSQLNVSDPAPPAQTVKIMDFSDPRKPVVARAFTGVTAIGRNDARGLIFLANAEGVWILQQHFAPDPALKKAYEDYIDYLR